jgi:hypothetical protein
VNKIGQDGFTTKLKGIALVIVFEGILSPALDIIKASLA